MNTAVAGRRAEHYVRDKYLAAGCEVIRAAGSKGKADLIVTIPELGALYYLNVKVNAWPGRREMATMNALAAGCRTGNWHVLVYRRDNRQGWRMRIVGAVSWLEGEAWWPPEGVMSRPRAWTADALMPVVVGASKSSTKIP